VIGSDHVHRFGSIQTRTVDNGLENVYQFCGTNGKYYIFHHFSQKYAKFPIHAVLSRPYTGEFFYIIIFF